MKCNLRHIMKEEGRTQLWLSKKAGVSNRTISEIINEKRIPTLPVAMRIAKVLDMTVEEIWEETSE